MLSRILIRQFRANTPFKKFVYRFGSGSHQVQHHGQHNDHHDNHDHHDHHDHHEHHDYSVHIDKNTTWLKYNGDPKLMYVLGI